MLNPFFLQGSKGEQGLVQDLVNEQLRMYGIECHYIPRKLMTSRTIMKEVVESRFDQAFPLEAYLMNIDGYAGQGDILTKFGVRVTDEATFVISKERFEESVAPFLEQDDDYTLSNRPKEGDLVFFPLGKRMFEIKFVEHERPFYHLFNIRYQLFLNDLYAFGSIDLLQYAMVQTKLEDITFLLNPDVRYRFNIRQDRLYIDVDWAQINKDDYFVIDCFRILDPDDFTKVYNDQFLKRYFTALCKRQWGQNLIKFQGVQLPGGIQLNGRQIYDDGVAELAEIRAKMASDYEMPPLDMIG